MAEEINAGLEPEKPKGQIRGIWAILIIVVAAILVGGGIWYFFYKTTVPDTGNLNTVKLSPSSSKSTSASTSVSPSTSNSSQTDLESAKTATSNFLDAKIQRSLAAAKSYMTTAFYNSTSQEEFAGTSNPHPSRYAIQKAEYDSTNKVYKVTARVYQALSGSGETSYNDNIYEVVKTNNQYLVNKETIGESINL